MSPLFVVAAPETRRDLREKDSVNWISGSELDWKLQADLFEFGSSKPPNELQLTAFACDTEQL
jgi:hypothetical protein